MKRFRMRLTLIIILMIGLSVTAAGLMMGKTYKSNHISALEDSMVREMRIINSNTAWQFASQAEAESYFQAKAKELKDLTGARVTFIRKDGIVLGDSDHDPSTMDNHLGRTEVKQAEQSGIGRAIRHSDTISRNMLYVAMAVDKDSPHSDIIRLSYSLETVERNINRLWTVLIIGLLLLFLVAAVVSYRIAKGLTSPLEQITDAAKRIRSMDYSVRVDVHNKDEIGELGAAINSMAEGLQVQMNRIQQNETQLYSVLDNMTSGVVMIDPAGRMMLLNRRAEEVLGFEHREMVGRPYSEAKQQYELSQIIQQGLEKQEAVHEEITFYFPEERLLELNLVPVHQSDDSFGGLLLVLHDVSAIRRLERMRSEFVANVSHELKTPITAIKGFAETLLGGAVNDPVMSKQFMQIIYDESERLNRLIGDILELSKIESRRVPLQFSPIDLASFMERSMTILESEAARKSIAMTLDNAPGIYLEADEDRLRQVVANLLQNGISYTPEGGKVSVRTSLVQSEGGSEMVQIRIVDTGIGIPRKDLPRIFERFYRVDKARSRVSGGTGLGLSIVKHLVELHHGSITVDSTVGVGTAFTIELPVIQP
ncbi:MULTISPECIES: ATP-binding protein [unclassified Paenibacillus]|uniref:two-component system histidine kinase PnpS n=1 Tax=unclassified Paenibacillus TaxID=185978 RepID=UPI0009573EB9|nr:MULTISPECIES: ATP-binding protein [unclassified Paenibacillus]ASS64730.1 HAMP domain-containing protein [Paenibacillus sp. RUD330]SIR08868.1 two-component system, OmpR family, phosphate regulon sensor histidine kinase PhoR [Paenibacillus sp. RU4X]SIR27481.1 two-component system, OmpR family, phosphate regulon sensor histidine kinase PhoR [Paenibacillus sp. RU4T]